MTRQYFVEYPRDFANEYSVYVVDSWALKSFALAFPGAKRITRAEAAELGYYRVRYARARLEQWFGGFHGVTPGDTLECQLDACANMTVESIRNRLIYLAEHGQDDAEKAQASKILAHFPRA